ncbi:ABC transporter permease [[Clostridium] polysaccharolyticum]|uniref:Putative ABC transport system permease protein n=1 Tax=[Clostridium] polysaccharolyticum TaxID=29364 RepID=A0A1H9ZXY4_9FIRM|nr:ABC transporter permease [[Clostridium] polysaccharolyticum]SES86252.1 putative ABC transport system permease protein [[Clostridium] polysaccharolyticum]
MLVKCKKVFRYPLSTFYVIVGLMVAFLMLFDGLSIYNEVTKAADEDKQARYNETTRLNVENTDKRQLTPQLFEVPEKVNVHLVADACIEGASGNVKADIVLQNAIELKILLNTGRLPTKKEIVSGKHVAVIRSGLESCTFVKDSKKYIEMNGTAYEVIGTMKEFGSNGYVFVYENCLTREMSKKIMNSDDINVIINSDKNNTYDAYNHIKSNMTDFSNTINVEGRQVDEDMDVLQYAMDNSSVVVVFVIYLFSIINCINENYSSSSYN